MSLSFHESLVQRVRGEYLEMPGLRLTLAQACRLWQIERPVCEHLLSQLVAQRFLGRTPDGAYIRVATPAPRDRTARRFAAPEPAPVAC